MAPIPSNTKPMWLTELQAILRFTLSWAKALSAPYTMFTMPSTTSAGAICRCASGSICTLKRNSA